MKPDRRSTTKNFELFNSFKSDFEQRNLVKSMSDIDHAIFKSEIDKVINNKRKRNDIGNIGKSKESKPERMSKTDQLKSKNNCEDPKIIHEDYTVALENEHSEKLNEKIDSNILPQLMKKDIDGDTPLHLLIVHKETEKSKSVIRLLTGKTDIPNKLRQTPLHLSVLTCQPSLVTFLIFHGASVNIVDRNGQTAMHLAVKNADVECVEAIKQATASQRYSPYYVQERPDLKLKNFKGETVFHLAVRSGSQKISKIILDMGADIDIKDGTCGRTGLHLAVESHNINMISFLLKNGANIDAVTFAGNTALHLASGHHMDQVVELLVGNGANAKIKNCEGDFALYPRVIQSWHLMKRKNEKDTLKRRN